MPRPRKTQGYSLEVAQLATLVKRAEGDHTKPAAWCGSVASQAQALIRLLLAADHDPSHEAATEARANKPR